MIMRGGGGEDNAETETPVVHKAFFGSSDHKPDHEMVVMTVVNSEPTTATAVIESWLPITESRSGTMFSAVSHLLSSGIGFQALLLPLPFTVFGWVWGIVCMWIAFGWQLYTTWLLVQLHESSSSSSSRGLGLVSMRRHSRFLNLSIQAFGPKLGKAAAMFPVTYLSGGSCVMMIITGGRALRNLINLWESHTSLSGVVYFLIFASVAVSTIVLLPNLNSLSKLSFIGSLAGIAYLTLLWILSVTHAQPHGVSHQTSHFTKTGMPGYGNISFAVTALVLAFRGHNVILEIQGTLPSSSIKPSYKTMWKAVMVSYTIIAFIFFPLAICGYWAYGNMLPRPRGGILIAFTEFHGDDTSKYVRGLIQLLLIISCLASFSIYAMPNIDNMEFIYVSMKKRRCSRWARAILRCLFGALVFFSSVAFPFLPKLGFLIGGLALPLTFSYPCFIWNSIHQPSRTSLLWCINFFLGCAGILLSMFSIVGAAWYLGDKGLNANFFKP